MNANAITSATESIRIMYPTGSEVIWFDDEDEIGDVRCTVIGHTVSTIKIRLPDGGELNVLPEYLKYV